MARIDDIQSADGTRIALYRWEPDGEPTGEILLCHGLGEHMGRYNHVAAAFTAKGWRVTGLDLRGHGHSDGKRGHVDDWRDYTADLRAAADSIGKEHALVAHSMGALVSLDYLRDAKDVTAAALSGAPLEPAVPAPAWKLYGARLLNRLLPRLSMDNEIPADWICNDPDVVKAYLADPLVFSTITPRWFHHFRAASKRIQAHGNYTMPIYLWWGEDDRIVDTSKLPTFGQRIGAVTRAWTGYSHETHNEKGQADVFNEVTTWLAPHLAKETAAA